MDVHKKDEFLGLFQEFIEEYLHTPEGEAHIGSYERIRAEGENNFSEIVGASDRGEDVVDAVLLKLLPYTDTDAQPQERSMDSYRPGDPGGPQGMVPKRWVDETGGLAGRGELYSDIPAEVPGRK